MNILYIGSSADWHVDLWTKHFAKENNVYLYSDREDYLRTQPFENVEIIFYNSIWGLLLNTIGSNIKRLFQINKFISAKYFGLTINKFIKNKNIDIVHAHSLYYGYVASFITEEVPIIFTPMGSDLIVYTKENFLYRYMASKAFGRANVVTSDSQILQNQGYALGANVDDNHIIQNGVDQSIFDVLKNDLKSQYHITNDEILIFSPRALTPLYNIDTILEALAILKKSGITVKCMFCYAFGDAYLSDLKRKVTLLNLNKSVIWIGRRSYAEMAQYYNCADVVISIPSSDSSPKSVYEAMFCGTPVVISDLEWSHEVLKSSDCIRVGVNDPKSLSEAILTLKRDKNLYNNLVHNGLKVAKENFGYEENMNKMYKIMKNQL